MDEVFGPRDLIDGETLRTLSRRSDRRGLMQLAAHLVLLAATGFLVVSTSDGLWLLLTLPAYGMALTFLFAPLHETIHRTAFRSRSLNDAVAIVCGLPLLLPPIWFRYFHFAHHRWTQDPGRDPELNPPKPASLRAWFWHVSGLPYWIAALGGLIGHARGRVSDPYIPPRDRVAIVREARIFVTLYLAIVALAVTAGWLNWLLLLWVIPALLTQPVLRLYLLAEHGSCEMTSDMLRNTRTTVSNPLVRFLAWNMPYHAEHHAFPGVPFHALPAMHRTLAARLGVVTKGYVAANAEIFRNIRDTGIA